MTEQSSNPAPRIALLTCRHHDHIDHASEGKLMHALVRRGAVVTLAAWDDVLLRAKDEDSPLLGIQVDANFYVLRTTWDYWHRLDHFKEFLAAIEEGQKLLNPVETVLANLDKAYMKELQAQGVPIVPTVFVEPGREASAVDEARSRGWSVVVVKPGVGAAASGLRRFDRIDEAVAEYLRELTATGTALLQKYLPRVVSEGETSLVYFDGQFSHAVTKVPAPGDFRSQVDFGGAYTLVEPTAEQRQVAELSLLAWEKRYEDKPLYARVDLVPGDDGRPLLGELELIEPELFLDMDVGAADRFADAILSRVRVPEPSRESLGDKAWQVGCIAMFMFGFIAFAIGVGTIFGWLFGGP